ncbi:MAG: Asp-tRNA(Asn)/Glu-tRNA(Gln) amidotransferase subunit GatB [Gammaproteobacteria bacterium]|nr:Asp-tRNA(Asn)/Glu-tRNA(Gln) amidotransferase subunit GatB [Gammaproteobacteria bacterium]
MSAVPEQWELVIGLEIHIRLATDSKLFSGSANAYGADANRNASALDLALPGTLPVLNEEAVRLALRFGCAIDAEIAPRSVFARKNYFYPDLPKGYQISQFELPIVKNGRVRIPTANGEFKFVGIERAHLEEDAGKSLHEEYRGASAIDLNRAGAPLIEIVSRPEMRTPEEAVAYMKKIHALAKCTGVSEANMEKGEYRCDANVSVRRRGETRLGTRTEIKNLNSFRFVEKAIRCEARRHIGILENGGAVEQATMLYDSARDETQKMRGKEESEDYRYFPDPDLPPLQLSAEYLEEARRGMPELPDARAERLADRYGLAAAEAESLAADGTTADYFERCVEASGGAVRICANWIAGPLSAALHRHDTAIEQSPVTARMLGGLVRRIADRTISEKIAKVLFQSLWDDGGDADELIRKQGLRQIEDEGVLADMADAVIREHPQQVRQYREGKKKVLGYLVGQLLKRSQGKANPQKASRLLEERLAE